MLLGIFHSVVVLEVALVFLEQVHKLEVKAYLHNEVYNAPPHRGTVNTVVKKEGPGLPSAGAKVYANNHFQLSTTTNVFVQHSWRLRFNPDAQFTTSMYLYQNHISIALTQSQKNADSFLIKPCMQLVICIASDYYPCSDQPGVNIKTS